MCIDSEFPTNVRPMSATASLTPTAARNRTRTVIFAVLLLGLAAWFAHFAWHAHFYESTDDAFVTGHVDQLSARVSGHVARILVEENQQVAAGDAVVQLDPLERQIEVRRTEAGLAQARAQAEQARAAVKAASTGIEVARMRVRTAEAGLAEAKARLGLAELTRTRVAKLFEQGGATTRAALDDAETALTAARAGCDAAEAELATARGSVESARAAHEVAIAQNGAAEAAIGVAEAEVADAKRLLDLCTVRAPVAGRIGRRNVEIGNYVQPGQILFSLVEPELWVVANFKETQLTLMREGQAVDVEVDALSGPALHGRVESFSPASGAQFALLPADNATGNFTKVVQRVPVKIVLDAASRGAAAEVLRAGLSTVVEVRVR